MLVGRSLACAFGLVSRTKAVLVEDASWKGATTDTPLGNRLLRTRLLERGYYNGFFTKHYAPGTKHRRFGAHFVPVGGSYPVFALRHAPHHPEA